MMDPLVLNVEAVSCFLRIDFHAINVNQDTSSMVTFVFSVLMKTVMSVKKHLMRTE